VRRRVFARRPGRACGRSVPGFAGAPHLEALGLDRRLDRGAIDAVGQRLAGGDAIARRLNEARENWLAFATMQSNAAPPEPRLAHAEQTLLHDLEVGLRALLREGVTLEGRMAPIGELRLGFWQLRLQTAEETRTIIEAINDGSIRDARGERLLAVAESRSHMHMERLRSVAETLDDADIARQLTELQASYRRHLHRLVETARAGGGAGAGLEEFKAQSAPLMQRYTQLMNAISQAGGRHIESIRQQRSHDLLVSGLMVLAELGLGIGLILILMHRVQSPLTRLRMALSGADGYFVDWHVPSRVVDYSTGFDVMLGFEPDEIPRTVDGLRWLYHPDDAPRLEAAHRAAYRGDTDRVDAELRMRKKGGGWHWVNIRIRVVARDGNGRAVRLIGVVYDVNARHKAEDELRRVRREEEAIFSSSPVAMLIVHDRIIRRCNRALELLFNRDMGSLIGQPTRVLFDSEADYEAAGERIYAALRQQTTFTYEAEYLRPHHGRFWARVQCNLLDPTEPELGHVFAFEDITKARRAQAELDAAVQRQRAMFAALPNGVLILRNRSIVDCNPRFAELYGYTQTELIGQSSRIFQTSDLDWTERGKITYAAMKDGGTYHARERVRRRDGSFLDVLVQGCWIDPGDDSKGAVFIHTPLNLLLDYPG